MSDQQLHGLLVTLGDAIRDLPEGKEHRALVDSFFAVVNHMQSKGLIPVSNWHLRSRRTGGA
jgi:hypothetical protein